MTEKEEKKDRIVVEVRWRDCFKFWLAWGILVGLPVLILFAISVALRG